jgi:hypothetical protein
MRPLAVLISAVLCVGCGGPTQASNGDGGTGQCLTPFAAYQPTQPGAWDSICGYPASREVTRTLCGDVTERCVPPGGTATPALSCVTSPLAEEPLTPESVTLTGFATVFSGGPDSKNITVKVYRAAAITAPTDLDTATPLGSYTTSLPAGNVTPADNEVRACPTDQVNSDLKIGCVIPHPAACGGTCQDTVDGRDFCYTPTGQSGTCVDRARYEPRYTIADIPTRTPLLIVTTGPGGKDDLTWSTLVQENEYISTAAPECGAGIITNCFHDKAGASPSFELNVNALSRGDYSSIAVAAGIAGGIPAGHGGIAGEVRDCEDMRLQWAQIGVTPAAAQLKYFNGNQWNTLPTTSPDGTCRLGLYAALDLMPGTVQIEAYGLVGSTVQSLGWYAAIVFPDAVTIVSINTGKPLPASP